MRVFFCNVILRNKLSASISDQFNFCCCLRRWCCFVTKLIENTDILNWSCHKFHRHPLFISNLFVQHYLCTSLPPSCYLHHPILPLVTLSSSPTYYWAWPWRPSVACWVGVVKFFKVPFIKCFSTSFGPIVTDLPSIFQLTSIWSCKAASKSEAVK